MAVDKLVSNDLLKKSSELTKRVETFAKLLDGLQDIDIKIKTLWREIYDNAITDREHAGMLFTDAWTHMKGGTQDHIALGTTMTKYIERMCKSNEQILQLAILIEKRQLDESSITSDDVFDKIGKHSH